MMINNFSFLFNAFLLVLYIPLITISCYMKIFSFTAKVHNQCKAYLFYIIIIIIIIIIITRYFDHNFNKPGRQSVQSVV